MSTSTLSPLQTQAPVRRKKRRHPMRTLIIIILLVCCVMAIKKTSERYVKDSGDWQLTLVNPWNELPENFDVSLKQLSDGQSVDKRCASALQEMMDDCRAAGYQPYICSSYRTQATQQMLFDNKVQRVMAEGYSSELAPIEAAKVVALPGTSEHQLGLAVDIVDINHPDLDDSQAETPTQIWLMENSWRYGFILRYAAEKMDITGIIYEPWHYRYVGKDAAKEIYDQGICLEEYLAEKSE